jgi:hypothetical protein
MVVVCALVGAAVTAVGKPRGGHVFTVQGIVVHHGALGRYSIIGPRRHLVPVDYMRTQRAPALAHRVTVRLRQIGQTFQQLSFTTGLAVKSVEISGLVTFVSPRGKRFTVSDYYGSILIRHRLRGALPGLFHRIVVKARFDPRGELVEQRLVDVGFHRDTIRFAGFLRYLVPPTKRPLATPAELLPRGSCARGCIVVSADDAGQAAAGDLIPVPLPASLPQASTSAMYATATTPHAYDQWLQAVERVRDQAIPLSVTQTQPQAPMPGPTTCPAGTVTITAPASQKPAGLLPPHVLRHIADISASQNTCSGSVSPGSQSGALVCWNSSWVTDGEVQYCSSSDQSGLDGSV